MRDFDTPTPSLWALVGNSLPGKTGFNSKELGPRASHATMPEEGSKMMYKAKASLDYRYHKMNRNFYAILWLISCGLFVAVFVPLGLETAGANASVLWIALATSLGVFTLILLPFAIYYEAKLIRISKIDDLVFSEVKFDNLVDESFGRIMKIHFVVNLVYEGRPLQKETADIFFTRSVFPNAVAADYLNQTVTVGYSPSYDELLVFPLSSLKD
jgi:hypothetical protein